jgi:RHS repeat-associated protein
MLVAALGLALTAAGCGKKDAGDSVDERSAPLTGTVRVTIDPKGASGPVGFYVGDNSWSVTADLQEGPYTIEQPGVAGPSTTTLEEALGELTVKSDGTLSLDTAGNQNFNPPVSTGPGQWKLTVKKVVSVTLNPNGYSFNELAMWFTNPDWSTNKTSVLIANRRYHMLDDASTSWNWNPNTSEQIWDPYIGGSDGTSPVLYVHADGTVSIDDAVGQQSFSVTGTTVTAKVAPFTVDLKDYPGKDVTIHPWPTTSAIGIGTTAQLLKGRRYSLRGDSSVDPDTNSTTFDGWAGRSGFDAGSFDVYFDQNGAVTLGAGSLRHFSVVTASPAKIAARIAYLRIYRQGYVGSLCISGVVCAPADGDLTAPLIVDRGFYVPEANWAPVLVTAQGTCLFNQVTVGGQTLPIKCGLTQPGPLVAPPAAPASLDAKLVNGSVLLTWAEVAAEDNYHVERKVDGGGFGEIATTPANQPTYNDATTALGHIYTYQVRAFNAGGGFSGYSPVAVVDRRLPLAPSGLAAVFTGSRHVDLTWTDNADNEAGYRVQRSTDAWQTFQTLPTTLAADTRSFTDTEAVEDLTNAYRVLAFNAAGSSTLSNTASVLVKKTPACAPGAVFCQIAAVVGNHNWTTIPFHVDPGLSVVPLSDISVNQSALNTGLVPGGLNGRQETPESTSCTGSRVDNIHWSYSQESIDVSFGGEPASCGACGCGAASQANAGLNASLELRRFHLPRYEYLPSTFGPGVFSNFDAQVTFYKNGIGGEPNAVVFDPRLDAPPVTLFEKSADHGDSTIDGIYEDKDTRLFRRLVLYNALTPSSAARVTDPFAAKLAVLERNEGGALWFEVINVDPTSTDTIEARLIAVVDRNSNQLAVSYQFAASATDQQLGSDRTQLWKKKQIDDKLHGHSLTLEYEQRPSSHRWVANAVKRTGLDGAVQTWAYKYAPAGEGADSLSEVVYPNGASSLFSKSYDASTQTWALRFDEVGGGTSKIMKTVHVTGPTFQRADGSMQAQAPNMVRRVVNGDGENIYSNSEDSSDLNKTYVRDGGRRVTRLSVDSKGFPLEIARARAAGDDPSQATYDPVQAFAPDAKGMIGRASDGLGASETYVRDPLSRQLTGVTGRDGTSASWTRNSFGLATHAVDHLGRTVDAAYDAKGNLLTATRPSGGATPATLRFTYDATTGLVTSLTDWRGQVTNFAYTASNYLASVTEPADVTGGTRPVTRFEYNAHGAVTAKVDPAGNRTTYDYDGMGRLVAKRYADGTSESLTYGTGPLAGAVVSQTDRNGSVTKHEYDLTRRLQKVTRAAGSPESQTETYQYLPGTELRAATISDGRRTEVTYDDRFRPTQTRDYVTDSQVLVSQQAYDQADRLVQDTDPYGRRTFRVLDPLGQVTRVVRELVPGGVPAGSVLTTLSRVTGPNPPYTIEDSSYSAVGQVLSKTNGRGVRTSHTYDALGRAVQTIEADGTTVSRIRKFEYDLGGRPTKETLPRTQREGRAFETVYTYTNRGLVATKTLGAGSTDAAVTSFTYTPTGRLATETDAAGGITAKTYDASDRLTTSKDALGNVTTYAYDGVGNTTSVKNPLGQATTTTYDRLGRKLTERNPAGESTTYQYDDDLTDNVGLDSTYRTLISELGLGANAHGSAVLVTNAAGEASLDVYDGRGRPRLHRDPKGNVGRLAYDAIVNGLIETKATSPLGRTLKSYADGAGKQRLSVDAAGKTTTQTFDAAGNLLAKRDPNSVGQDCVYNELDQATSCTDTQGDKTSTEYDAAGNAVAIVNGLGVRTTCTYDTLDRKASCKDGIGAVTSWTYDKNSRLLKVTDAQSGVTTYAYDARGLKTAASFPDSSSSTDKMSWGYDSAGRLNKITNNSGHVINLTYDTASRLVTRGYPDGKNDTYTYDKASRMKTATSARYGTDVAWTYDGAGHIAKESLTFQAKTYDVGQSYDVDGHSIALTYPDGTQLNRTYDSGDHLTGLTLGTDSIATMAYDDGGRPTSVTMGNGLVETRRYRGDDRLASINTPGVGDLSYIYDAAKRKGSEAGTALTGGTQSYTYDNASRVTRWTAGSTTQSWALSPVGDWTSTTRGSTTESRTHNAAHELLTVAGHALAYDARGDMKTNDHGDTFTWDDLNQMQTATKSGGTASNYFYDATGRRVARVTGTNTTVYIHAGDQMIAHYLNGSLSVKYILGRGPDEYLALVKSGKTYWYSSNHVGTVEALTDSTRAIKERYSYTAYGERTIWSSTGTKLSSSGVANSFGFTGRYHDSDSGVMDFRSRQYDPRLGRFISRDDAYRDGLNLYLAYFVPNGADPFGHFWDWVPKVYPIAGIRFEAGVRMEAGGYEPGLYLFAKVSGGVGVRAEGFGGSATTGIFGSKEWKWRFLPFESEHTGPPPCSNNPQDCCGDQRFATAGYQTPNFFKFLEDGGALAKMWDFKMSFSKRGCKIRWDATLRVDFGRLIPGLQEIEFASEALKLFGLDGLKTGGYGKIVMESCLRDSAGRSVPTSQVGILQAEVGFFASLGNPP